MGAVRPLTTGDIITYPPLFVNRFFKLFSDFLIYLPKTSCFLWFSPLFLVSPCLPEHFFLTQRLPGKWQQKSRNDVLNMNVYIYTWGKILDVCSPRTTI